jgi:hypothetical protein
MPLRDHFRPPLDDVRSWEGLHAGWPMMIVRQLIEILPEPYFAEPGVHLGTLFEVDIGTFHESPSESDWDLAGEGGVAVATYAPPKPTLILEPRLPGQDVYEVRVFDSRRKRKLVAAIEIVSPSNKDRPETRGAFVSKVAALLKQHVCVTIVDVVSTSAFNLYAELLNFLDEADHAPEGTTTPMYASTCRLRNEGERRLMENWYYPLAIGEPLPTLPVWLNSTLAVSLVLEASYEETCRTLRIR